MSGWGIVGTGWIADAFVAPAIAKLDGSELVASLGSSPAKSEAFAARHGGKGRGSLEELLADPAVGIVYVATPNALHAEEAIAAAAAGKHVFCDKPIATTVADAKRMLEACDRAGVKFGVNFQTRHHEGMAEIRETVGDGGIGEPLVVQCEVSPGAAPLAGWRTKPELASLGTIINLGVHAYDLLRYLLDAEVDEVTALTNVGRRDELETIALALLRFSNGALAYVNANQAVPDFQPDLVLYGSAGRIAGRRVTRPNLADGEIEIRSSGEARTLRVSSVAAFDRAVAAFQHAVDADETPNASGLDGLRSVELTTAMARSAREGVTASLAR